MHEKWRKCSISPYFWTYPTLGRGKGGGASICSTPISTKTVTCLVHVEKTALGQTIGPFWKSSIQTRTGLIATHSTWLSVCMCILSCTFMLIKRILASLEHNSAHLFPKELVDVVSCMNQRAPSPCASAFRCSSVNLFGVQALCDTAPFIDEAAQ